MLNRRLMPLACLCGLLVPAGAGPARVGDPAEDEESFTDTFGEEDKDLVPTGSNPFFVLEPGFFIELQGTEGGKPLTITITITVLDETRKIAGVDVRAVEEKEIVNGEVKEITRDYFAISKRTNNVYYFGEDVDEYEDGKVVGHPGSWHAGEKGARYGLFMPGSPLLGARYCQEIAPGVAMDRARVVSLTGKLETPAGGFENLLTTEETNAVKKDEKELKRYARGIGVIQDGNARLTRYGSNPAKTGK